jgi:hypothetical protein
MHGARRKILGEANAGTARRGDQERRDAKDGGGELQHGAV